MPAILFGSIGTVAETSELQRQSFNEAFKAHGLSWHWEREEYRKLLIYSGGAQRIAACAKGQDIDAHAIHQTKSDIYQALLSKSGLLPRSGVLETIRAAQQQGVAVALVSATSPENVSQLISALHPHLVTEDFSLLMNSMLIAQRKPAPDVYAYALKALGIPAQDCIAIEDNADGVASAAAAGIRCVAFPGENTADHDYSGCIKLTHRMDFNELMTLISSHAAKQ